MWSILFFIVAFFILQVKSETGKFKCEQENLVRRQIIRTYPPVTALLINGIYVCNEMEETIFELVSAIVQSESGGPISDNLKSDTNEFQLICCVLDNYGSLVFLANNQIINLLNNKSYEKKDGYAKRNVCSNSTFTSSEEKLDEFPDNSYQINKTSQILSTGNGIKFVKHVALSCDKNITASHDKRIRNTKPPNFETTQSKDIESSTYRNPTTNVILNSVNNYNRNVSTFNTTINDLDLPYKNHCVGKLCFIQNGTSNNTIDDKVPFDYISMYVMKSRKIYIFPKNNEIDINTVTINIEEEHKISANTTWP